MGLEHLSYDPAAADDSQTVGSYTLAGDDGAQISSKSISATNWLQTASATHAGDGTAITATGTSMDVNVTNSLGIDVDLDHTEDSVQLGDGTNLLTSTTVGSNIALDVNMVNDPSVANDIVVNASPLTDVEATIGANTAGRQAILVQNLGANECFIGEAGVTDATGFRLSKNSVIEIKVGAAVVLKGICKSGGTADTRYMELVRT